MYKRQAYKQRNARSTPGKQYNSHSNGSQSSRKTSHYEEESEYKTVTNSQKKSSSMRREGEPSILSQFRQPALPVQGVPTQRTVIDWSHCLKKSEEVKPKNPESTYNAPIQEPQIVDTQSPPQNELNLHPATKPSTVVESAESLEASLMNTARQGNVYSEDNGSMQPQVGMSPLQSPGVTWSQSSSIASSTTDPSKRGKPLGFSLGSFGDTAEHEEIMFGSTVDEAVPGPIASSP